MQNETLYEELEKMAKQKGLEIYKISAATGQGIKELMARVSQVLKTLPKEDLVEIEKSEKLYTLKDEEEISVKKEDDIYIVSGTAVEKLMRTVNLEDNESLHYFHKRLNEMGINEKLKGLGIKDGDWVQISDYELEWED